MKRYWLFMYEEWHAKGGMFDFAGSFDSERAAIESIDENVRKHQNRMLFYHIFDSFTDQMVSYNDGIDYHLDDSERLKERA